MALLTQTLSVWEIAHRWAGHDPSVPRVWLPLLVRDNCRILIDAILNGEIDSLSLQLRKWRPEDGEDTQPFFIRYYMDQVYECVWGKKFDRKLLRHASIERHELKLWCAYHSIPLPEFWFPAGWGEEYDWKKRDGEVDVPAVSQEDEPSIRPSTAAKITCQMIARELWKEFPNMTIADMVKNAMIQRYGGAAVYTGPTVRAWLSAVAPTQVKEKRGRPRKKMPGEGGDGDTSSEE